MKKKLVKVVFLDHCVSIGGCQPPVECTVYGLLVGEDKNAYYVCSWLAGDTVDENADVYTILKKVVTMIRSIKGG